MHVGKLKMKSWLLIDKTLRRNRIVFTSLSVPDVSTHTVRSLITVLILFRSSPKRRTATRNISISVSVHLALWKKAVGLNTRRQTAIIVPFPSFPLFELRKQALVALCECVSYPAGLESDTGCSCIVSSPSLVKAAPAAEKISPTCSSSRRRAKAVMDLMSA